MGKEKSNPKLWELKRGTKVKIGNMIAEFLGVDGMYCRWKVEGSENITIIGHANQKVSEYGEIIEQSDLVVAGGCIKSNIKRLSD